MVEVDGDKDLPDWRINIISKLGLPTALLIFIFLGIYRAASWTGTNVVTPMVQKQVSILANMDTLLQSAERYSRENQTILKEQSASIQRLSAQLEILQNRERIRSEATP